MRALVTGGAGFIGSNIVDALVARGDDVVALDDLSTGRRANLGGALAAGAELAEADIRDVAAVDAAFAAHRPEVVFHCAAQIDVRRSVADPATDARINIEGTYNVLEAARRTGTARLVYSATGGALYGVAGVVPTPEGAPVRPLAPYGQSSYAAEGACHLYQRLHGLSTVALRYANVYGPRQDPLGEGGVVAIFCGCAIARERPTVFGDGRQTRDFVYVGDVVQANLMAAGAPGVHGAYNVGTGEETSVLDLLAELAAVVPGAPLEPEFAPARLGEIERSALDAGLAAEVLGWHPATSLREGLRRTLDSVHA